VRSTYQVFHDEKERHAMSPKKLILRKPRFTEGVLRSLKSEKRATPADTATNGIAISQATDLTPGTNATLTPQSNFIGRAILFPPGTVPGVDPQEYVFMTYATGGSGAATVFVPDDADTANILYADLPNGVLPIASQPGSLLDQITAAWEEVGQPVDSTGTGNNDGH
jgi:hypothetical protein